jgi:hypothetical protein
MILRTLPQVLAMRLFVDTHAIPWMVTVCPFPGTQIRCGNDAEVVFRGTLLDTMCHARPCQWIGEVCGLRVSGVNLKF